MILAIGACLSSFMKSYYHFRYYRILYRKRISFIEFIPIWRVDIITSTYIRLPVFMFRSELARIKSLKDNDIKRVLINLVRHIRMWIRIAWICILGLIGIILWISLIVLYDLPNKT